MHPSAVNTTAIAVLDTFNWGSRYSGWLQGQYTSSVAINRLGLPPPLYDPDNHSSRRACIGSRRAARIAGNNDAKTETASTMITTPPSVAKSVADTPYSMLDSVRANAA